MFLRHVFIFKLVYKFVKSYITDYLVQIQVVYDYI